MLIHSYLLRLSLTLDLTARFCPGRYFTPLLVLSLPCMILGYRRAAWVRLLRVTLSLSGPAFIKWGQWAATRHDMFPRDVCTELQKLHSDAPSHNLAHTESEIEDSFGFRVEDLFEKFECDPVASGSIGQIHRCALSDVGARLTGVDQGTVVAVKVRHPGVTRAIQRDFELMMAVIDGLGQVCRANGGLRSSSVECLTNSCSGCLLAVV